MKRVLFLCSGNYYRSRLAEILFNWHAEQLASEWRADSRGLALDPRNPGLISLHTLDYLRRRGIQPVGSERLPIAVCADDFAKAGAVVAVKEAEHRPLMEALFPQWHHRVEYWNVHDLDCATPGEAIPILEAHVEEFFRRITGADGSSVASK